MMLLQFLWCSLITFRVISTCPSVITLSARVSVLQSIYQPIDQSVHQPIDQSVHELVDQSVYHSIDQSVY